jgi:hypothetical protein
MEQIGWTTVSEQQRIPNGAVFQIWLRVSGPVRSPAAVARWFLAAWQWRDRFFGDAGNQRPLDLLSPCTQPVTPQRAEIARL